MSSQAPSSRKKPSAKDAGGLASIKKRIKGKEVGCFFSFAIQIRTLKSSPPFLVLPVRTRSSADP